MSEHQERLGTLLIYDLIALILAAGIGLAVFRFGFNGEVDVDLIVFTLFFTAMKILVMGIFDITGIAKNFFVAAFFVTLVGVVILVTNMLMVFGISRYLLLANTVADIALVVCAHLIWRVKFGRKGHHAEVVEEDEEEEEVGGFEPLLPVTPRREPAQEVEKSPFIAGVETEAQELEADDVAEGFGDEYALLFDEEEREAIPTRRWETKGLAAARKEAAKAEAELAQESPAEDSKEADAPEAEAPAIVADESAAVAEQAQAQEISAEAVSQETDLDFEDKDDFDYAGLEAGGEADTETGAADAEVEIQEEETTVETIAGGEDKEAAEPEEGAADVVIAGPDVTAALFDEGNAAALSHSDAVAAPGLDELIVPVAQFDDRALVSPEAVEPVPEVDVAELLQVPDAGDEESHMKATEEKLNALLTEIRQTTTDSSRIEQTVAEFKSELEGLTPITDDSDIKASGEIIREKLKSIIDRQFLVDGVLDDLVLLSQQINRRIDDLDVIEEELKRRSDQLSKKEFLFMSRKDRLEEVDVSVAPAEVVLENNDSEIIIEEEDLNIIKEYLRRTQRES